MKSTLQEKHAASLMAEGWTEEKGRSSKYRVFTKTGRDFKFFLGKAGAIRKGKNIAESVSLTRFYNVKLPIEKGVK